MEKMTLSGKTLRRPVLLATLLLTALSLSACVVPRDRGERGDWNRHHHWNNDRSWNDQQDWQDNHGSWHGDKHHWD